MPWDERTRLGSLNKKLADQRRRFLPKTCSTASRICSLWSTLQRLGNRRWILVPKALAALSGSSFWNLMICSAKVAASEEFMTGIGQANQFWSNSEIGNIVCPINLNSAHETAFETKSVVIFWFDKLVKFWSSPVIFKLINLSFCWNWVEA